MTVYNCMLADSLNDKTIAKLKYPVAVEPKLDGVRVYAIVEDYKVKFFTRNGKELFLPRIAAVLADYTDTVFDGEVTSEAEGQDRQTVAGRLNHIRAHGKCEDGEDYDFIYNVFDCLRIEEWESKISLEGYIARKDKLYEMFDGSLPIVPVIHGIAENKDDIDNFYDLAIERKLEGIVVKPLDGLYEWKRSKAWLKKKEAPTCDLLCYGYTEGTGKREGKIGSLLCTTSCNKLKVSVGTGLNDSQLDELTKNPPINKVIEIKYNAVIKKRDSDIASLFLPVFVQIREDKQEYNSLEDLEI